MRTPILPLLIGMALLLGGASHAAPDALAKFGTLRLTVVLNGKTLVGEWEIGSPLVAQNPGAAALSPTDAATLHALIAKNIVTLRRGSVNDLSVYLTDTGKKDITLDPQLAVWSGSEAIRFARGKLVVSPPSATDEEYLSTEVFPLYVCYSVDKAGTVFGCNQFFLKTQ